MDKIQRKYNMPKGKEFRNKLGFSNQNTLKHFFKLTDVTFVNWDKIEFSNQRLGEIFTNLNNAVHEDIKYKNINKFTQKINQSYNKMKNNKIIQGLNNQGRAPEDVYYSWMRGFLVCEFFQPAVKKLFNTRRITHIGKDDLTKIETVQRNATADYEFEKENKTYRIEIQAGFTGQNDIKKSKIEEAQKQKNNKISSYLIHFDLFNGCAAVIDISDFYSIPNEYYKIKFENTKVLPIKEEWFKWNLTEKLPKLDEICVKYTKNILTSE